MNIVKKYFLFFVILLSFIVLGFSYYKYAQTKAVLEETQDINLRNFNRYALKALIFTHESHSFYLDAMFRRDGSIKDELPDKMGTALSFFDIKSSEEDSSCFRESKESYEALYNLIDLSDQIYLENVAQRFSETVKKISACILSLESARWIETNRFLADREIAAKESNRVISYLNIGALLLLSLIAWLIFRVIGAEKEIKKQKIELEQIIDTQSSMVVITEGKEMLKCNKKSMGVLGFKNIDEFLKGHSCICEFFKRDNKYLQKEEDGVDWLHYLINAKASGRKDTVLIYDVQKESDRIFKIEVGSYIFDNREQHIVVFNDVTEIVLAKERMEQFNEALMSQVESEVSQRMALHKEKSEQEKLLIQQSKMAMMGDMIAVIAHQWKQPLNSMFLMLQMYEDELNDGVEPKEVFEALSKNIHKQIKFMIQTMDEFRNFFKPSKEKIVFNISNEIANIVSMFSSEFKILSIKISSEMDSSLQTYGYPNELMQVVMNIFSSAKDVLQEQRKNDKSIIVILSRNGEMANIMISDNGGGIPEELLPDKLFGDYVSTKGEKGTGIGLSLSKLIIEKNFNGRISARNLEEGACFEIVLPISK